MVAATLTEPQVATGLEAGLRYWLTFAVDGDFEPTIYSVTMGGFGVVVYLATIVLATWLVFGVSRSPAGPTSLQYPDHDADPVGT
jgi:hypothetical protein